MSAEFFLQAIDAALFAKVNGDSGFISVSPGGIWRTTAPDGTPFPLTHFTRYGAGKADYSLSKLIRAQMIYEVKSISSEAGGQTDADAYAAIGYAFNLLQDAQLNFGSSGWLQLRCRWEAKGISYEEGVAGQLFYHRGDYLDINVTPAS